MFENIINQLNDNRFFIGIMVMFVTIGGRFIINELSEQQRQLINDPNIKKVFIFCAFFTATRDLKCAFVLTILFILIVTELFSGDIFFMDKEKEMKEGKKYDTITNDKKIDQIIFELNQMKNVY
tara:strand:+ start:427 stop:798 length:372 start_codon:yes stop_codon:yes gene_type:complete